MESHEEEPADSRPSWKRPASACAAQLPPDHGLAVSCRNLGRGIRHRPVRAYPRNPLVLGRRYRRTPNAGSRNCGSRYQYCSHGSGQRRFCIQHAGVPHRAGPTRSASGEIAAPAADPVRKSRTRIALPPPPNRMRISAGGLIAFVLIVTPLSLSQQPGDITSIRPPPLIRPVRSWLPKNRRHPPLCLASNRPSA